MQTKNVIREQSGVRLIETILHGDHGVELRRAYSLLTKRTPLAETFGDLAAAEAAFHAEVARCT
jgi:hypothetical protein